MDLIVTPGSRIAALPKPARLPALLARNALERLAARRDALAKRLYGFVYLAYGMGTAHHSPFLGDARFDAAYDRLATFWWHGRRRDVRWTIWFLTRCASQCASLPGAFVEFGVGRAGYAFMILSLADLPPDRRFYLFDTFRGVPATNLTEAERQAQFAGRHADTSVAHVREVLAPWRDQTELVAGDVFATLPETETGPIAFCHMDLNASAPTERALEYLYPRLLPSAMVVLDDYGHLEYEDQRRVVDAFFADKPERPIAIPTGQGLIVKT